MIATANPIPSSAAASPHAATSPSLELLEARRARDGLATLLRREQVAMAEFLLALSDFDRRRGWEALGHASLFAFLTVELHLSRSAAFWRLSAARLLRRFPEVIEPLRDGRLCMSTTAELAKVLKPDNLFEVLPRFYRLSAREAAEVTAALLPREQPPLRTVVTALEPERRSVLTPAALPVSAAASPLEPEVTRTVGAVLTSEPLPPHSAVVAGRRDDVEPLTADLRRLHITVDAQFLKMLDAARDGLSHAIPGASTEQVLKAALELLLEKQARARGLVKRPRTVVATPTPTPAPTGTALPSTAAPGAASVTVPASDQVQVPAQAAAAAAAAEPDSVPAAVTATDTATATAEDPTETPPPDFTPPRYRRTDPRRHVPAAVSRAVWQRDGGRCAWPLDGGGVCGSTHQLELDHIVPWARWGGETVEDLRIACHTHNMLAARIAFGDRCVDRYAAAPAGG